jgi:hypothetical protein
LGSPLGHLKKKLAKVELCEGLVENRVESSKKCEYLITKSTSLTHSGGFVSKPSQSLSALQFVCTMALNALEIG